MPYDDKKPGEKIGSGNGLLPDETKPLPGSVVTYHHYCVWQWLSSFQYKPQMDLKLCLHYHKTSNISRTFVGNKIVDNSDVVAASPVGAAPTTSSFST